MNFSLAFCVSLSFSSALWGFSSSLSVSFSVSLLRVCLCITGWSLFHWACCCCIICFFVIIKCKLWSLLIIYRQVGWLSLLTESISSHTEPTRWTAKKEKSHYSSVQQIYVERTFVSPIDLIFIFNLIWLRDESFSSSHLLLIPSRTTQPNVCINT